MPDASTPSTSRPRSLYGLGFLLLLCLVRLVAFDDPFSDGVAERERDGDVVRPEDFATTYTWWMALVNGLFLSGLLLTWRRWWGPAVAPADPRFASPGGAPPRWLRAGVALAMVGLAWTAVPRLSHSFWEDEEYMVVRSIAGRYEPGPEGLRFHDVPWSDTFFYYRKPNNHVPYSVAARLSHDAYRLVAGPDHELVDEAVVRLPALVAGMAGLGSLAWLLWRLGMPFAALAGAWLLALHPWYARFASEVRGYAILLALVPAVVITAWRVLERGTWGRWTAYAAVQALLLWTYPGALTVLIASNLFVAAALVTGPAAPRRTQLTRFLIANTAAALAWLQMNLPNMMQFLPYTEVWTGDISRKLLLEIGSLLALGMPAAHEAAGFVSMRDQLADSPAQMALLLGGLAGALLLGSVRLARSAAGRLGLAVFLLPAPLTLLLASLRGDHLYPWYLIHALPGAVALVAAGLTLPVTLGGRARAPALAVGVGVVALFAVCTHPMRSDLRERPMQPSRDMVLTVRGNLNPLAEEQDEILTGAVYGAPRYYDPRAIDLPTPEDVTALMRRADREERPLFVTVARPELAAKRRAESLAMLGREDLFEPMAAFEGVYPKARHEVYRYRPGSLAD